MRLSIRHTTSYHFTQPVSHGVQRLRLTPKATQGQKIVRWDMDYEGGVEQFSYDDQNFNSVTLLSLEEGATELIVSCTGEVETQDNAGVIGNHAGHLPIWSFLAQTKLTSPGPAVRELLSQVERSEEGMVATLHNLSTVIRENVDYGVGSTIVSTTAEEAAADGNGVCQDHAHIFIGAARALEIPARYVSGYLMMNDRVEQDATHAWAEAFVQGLGWVGFDISNGISPDPRYIRVATGRDYRDAAPITGVSFGSQTANLTVSLAVEQQQDQGQRQEQQ